MRELQGGTASGAGAAIGAAIRTLRRQRGWSIEALAGRAGLSYQYLCEIETGKRNFTIVVLDRIAGGLQMSIVGLVTAAMPAVVGPERPVEPERGAATAWSRAA